MTLSKNLRDFIHDLFLIETVFKLIIIGLVFGLSASLISQYFFNFIPCKLCIAQRILFTGSLIFTCISYYLVLHNSEQWKLFSYLSIIGLFLAFSFSAYQLLIQFEILPEPEFCSVNLSITNKSIEDLEQMFENSSYITSCKALGPTLFNLPISFFSCLGSISGMIYICIAMFLAKSEK